MSIKRLLTGNDRAVSPVIGVILMVAITVILAATIGSLVIGFGDTAGDAPVSASASAAFHADDDQIAVTHQGEAKDDTTLNVSIRDSSGSEVANATLENVADRATFGTGDGLADGTEYRVVVTAEEGDRTSIILDRTDDI